MRFICITGSVSATFLQVRAAKLWGLQRRDDMRYTKYFAGCALAVGLLVAGTPTATAQDWRYQSPTRDQYGNPYYRQDIRNGYPNAYGYTNAHDSGNRYDRIEELQEHIAHDRVKLNEAIR